MTYDWFDDSSPFIGNTHVMHGVNYATANKMKPNEWKKRKSKAQKARATKKKNRGV